MEYCDGEGIRPFHLAQRARIDPSQLSRWMSGETRPSLRSAIAIEEATGGAIAAADLLRHLLPPSHQIRRVEERP